MTQTHATQKTFLEAVVREMEERVDAEFGVDAFQDLGWSWLAVFLRRPKTRKADLECLAGRLVRCGHWKLHDPEAKRRLQERAHANNCKPQEEQIELARFGLEWASDGLELPHPIRLGESQWLPVKRRDEWSVDEEGSLLVPRKIRNPWKLIISVDKKGRILGPVGRIRSNPPSKPVVQARGQWIKDEHGHQVAVIPDRLSPGVKLTWYVAAAKRVAGLALEGKPPDKVLQGAVSLEDWEDWRKTQTDDDHPPSALDALEAADQAEAARVQVADLLDAVTPGQEKIIAGMLERFGEDLTEDEARAAVAKDLGISRSTVRGQLLRLRQKQSR